MSIFLILAAAPFLQSFQDSDTNELRFHRVHLRNGNFIDGHVVKQTSTEVVLKLKAGEMGIKRDQIENVELVRMKSNNVVREFLQGPKVTPKTPGVVTPPKGADVKVTGAESTPGEIRKRVEVLVWRLKTQKGDEKQFNLAELGPLGEEGLIYLLSKAPEFDLALLDATAAAVIQLKPTPKVTAAAEQLLKSENTKVRAMAVSILGATQSESDKLQFLRPSLKDTDPRVREQVLSMLGSSTDQDLFGDMTELCGDVDPEVRGRALRIAKNIAEKHGLKDQYVRTVVGNLGSSDAGVRSDSAAVLGSTGMPESWNHLVPVLNDPEPRVRAVAAQALMNLGAPESGETVLGALVREQDKWARIALAGAAEKLKLAKAIEIFVDWMGDQDADVKKAAQVALTLLTGENLGPDRQRWVDWWDKHRK